MSSVLKDECQEILLFCFILPKNSENFSEDFYRSGTVQVVLDWRLKLGTEFPSLGKVVVKWIAPNFKTFLANVVKQILAVVKGIAQSIKWICLSSSALPVGSQLGKVANDDKIILGMLQPSLMHVCLPKCHVVLGTGHKSMSAIVTSDSCSVSGCKPRTPCG